MPRKIEKKRKISLLKRRSRAEIGKIPPQKVEKSAKTYQRKKKHPPKPDE
jgi:hypothetical protein